MSMFLAGIGVLARANLKFAQIAESMVFASFGKGHQAKDNEQCAAMFQSQS